ncbi:DUF421 domain-containing protein [Acetanaerobacterium elongatum]|uniref:Uncharacterized membrane protein YcaP, DUF421 family n=1 Tax=Acetanaerobacterium elongatum TaxID=258515 RepID=A0A1H0FF00_9FIRM|nr:DUF421 domain-containing protein [Acetanaerobacterium elongatum]SDN93233.1 Uncharacterized membrane protein YcaP, DUF421 family [Acetanaerobacterium elongatum]
MIVVFFRTILLYMLIIFSLRLMGKRQLGELQPSELVVTILISNIASLPIEDTNIPLLAGAVPILTLVSFEIIISAISLKNIKFRNFISGNTKVIIKDGQIDQAAMRDLRFSVDDLMEELRGKDVFDVRDVQVAIVETSGTVSIYLKPDKQPVTAQQMNIKTQNVSPPVVVVSDGDIIKQGLEFCGVNRKWLDSYLKRNNYKLDEIFIMTLDSSKSAYIIPKQKELKKA